MSVDRRDVERALRVPYRSADLFSFATVSSASARSSSTRSRGTITSPSPSPAIQSPGATGTPPCEELPPRDAVLGDPVARADGELRPHDVVGVSRAAVDHGTRTSARRATRARTGGGALSGSIAATLTIVVTGRPILNGHWRGNELGSCSDCWHYHEQLRSGRITSPRVRAADRRTRQARHPSLGCPHA